MPIQLPPHQYALLKALAAGTGMIRLADGSLGMLPKDWLARYARNAAGQLLCEMVSPIIVERRAGAAAEQVG